MLSFILKIYILFCANYYKKNIKLEKKKSEQTCEKRNGSSI